MSTSAKAVKARKPGHRKPKRSYGLYVSRIFKIVNSAGGLSGDAKAVATSMIMHLVEDVSSQTKELLAKDKKKTATDEDVIAVVKTMVPQQKFEEIKRVIGLTIEKFNKAETKKQDATLLFLPIARIHTAMKEQKVGSRVSPTAAVALARFVQDEVMNVLDVANQIRKDEDKSVRVTAQHIHRAILLENVKIFDGIIKHGGVKEHVEEALIPKKRKRSDSTAAAPKKAKK
jgi:histone H2B